MIACLDPRKVALEVAGKYVDPEGWAAAVHEIKKKTAAVLAQQRASAKESQRSQKKSEGDPGPGDTGPSR